MELQEFIKATLSEIVDGVKEFQETDVAGVGDRHYGSRHGGGDAHCPYQLVRFDIALAEGTQEGSKKGIGVFLAGIGVGGQARGESTASSHTRVSFSVPIRLSGSVS